MTIDRASIPEEFYDKTSGMLLVQPRPDFFYAKLAKMALASAMDLGLYGASQAGIAGSGSNGTPRGVPGVGPTYSSAQHDRLQLMPDDGVHSDFALVVDEIASPNVGHTIRINRPKFSTAALYTQASREIKAASTISTTGIDIGSEQMSLTVKRYGGPHDGTNVAPFSIDRFDAIRMIHSALTLAGKHLQDDFDKWLDRVVALLLDVGTGSLGAPGAPTSVWPIGFTSDDSALAAGGMPGDAEMLARVEAALLTGNVPRFANCKYMGVISPMFIYNLKQDPQWNTQAKYFRETNPIFQSYVANYGGVDYFQSTSLTATNNSSSVPVTTSHVFGPAVIALGVSRLPEVLSSTDDNYGELAKLIWAAYMAFATADQRFCALLKTA